MRSGCGLGVERFEWFRFSVLAVPLERCFLFFCVSVQFDREGRFQLRFQNFSLCFALKLCYSERKQSLQTRHVWSELKHCFNKSYPFRACVFKMVKKKNIVFGVLLCFGKRKSKNNLKTMSTGRCQSDERLSALPNLLIALWASSLVACLSGRTRTTASTTNLVIQIFVCVGCVIGQVP